MLVLAAFRTWRLIAEDTIFDRPRKRFLKALPAGEYWVTCPWCSGAWVALGWWLAWVASQRLRDYPTPPADEPLIPILQDWL